jgi:hypothetical protein
MASVDPLALVVGSGFLALVLFSVLAVVLNLLPHGVRSHRVVLSGALAAGWAGFALLNAVFGLFVLGLNWAPIYLQSRFRGLSQLRNTVAVDCSSPDSSQGMTACVRTVYPYEPQGATPWFHLTFVPAILYVAVLLILLLVVFGRPNSASPGIGAKGHFERRAHATVLALGSGSPWRTLTIVLVAAGATLFSWLRIVDDHRTAWDGLAGLVAHAGALVGVLRLITEAFSPVIPALAGHPGDGKNGGGWPVTSSPLGAASPFTSMTQEP